jgi:hypothetical protein
MYKIFDEIAAERRAQDKKWGGATHDDEHDDADWRSFIMTHNNYACGDDFRKEMIRVAALAVAAVQSFDRRKS